MTIKKLQQVLVQGAYNAFLLNLDLPEPLLGEIQSFINHNSILEISSTGEKVCCMRCLKANIIKKAREMNASLNYEKLSRLIDEKTGHEGYYLDEDRLVEFDMQTK